MSTFSFLFFFLKKSLLPKDLVVLSMRVSKGYAISLVLKTIINLFYYISAISLWKKVLNPVLRFLFSFLQLT